jgi:hypothetical protein
MGREIKEPKHLLDTEAEQNIGNSAVLQPQSGLATTIPQNNPARILDLTGPSQRGQTTSVVFTASRILGEGGYAGPITGVVEFGNGGRFTRVEVDVPIGPYLGFFQGALPSSEPQDGGAIVSVPTGVLRAYCRYDNLLIQPSLGAAPYAFAEKIGVSFIGPGGPHTDVPAPGTIVPPEPVMAKAMAAYFSRHFSRAYKTQYCYVGDNPGGVPIPAQTIGSGQAIYCVPAFAKSLKVLRWPITAALDVYLYDGIQALDQIAIASGTAPTIQLVGNENIVMIASTPPGPNAVTFLALCYEIGV